MRLIAPKFVKRDVRNQKNDMTGAEAVAEAVGRPTMHFVEVKTSEQQGLGMIFRLRDLLVGQRTQTINALHGHLAEFGLVVGMRRECLAGPRAALEQDEEAVDIPASVRHMAPEGFDLSCPDAVAEVIEQVLRDSGIPAEASDVFSHLKIELSSAQLGAASRAPAEMWLI